jgi:ABC-type oligopeptide transport system substrate-binding subunit
MNTLTKDRDAMSRFQAAFVLTLLLALARSFFPDFMNSQRIISVVWAVLIYGSVATGVFAWLFDVSKLRDWHFISEAKRQTRARAITVNPSAVQPRAQNEGPQMNVVSPNGVLQSNTSETEQTKTVPVPPNPVSHDDSSEQSQQQASSNTLSNELQTLAKLRDEGKLTLKEFKVAKKQLLDLGLE